MNLSLLCTRIIRAGFLALFTLVPLLLTPWNYELFEYNKMMLTYGLTVIIGSAWVIKMIADKEIRIAKTPLDIPIALFVTSQFISTLFSIDPHVSWFGYYSRFNGGMWSTLAYVTLYYALVSNFMQDNATKKTHVGSPVIITLLKAATITGVVVSAYGALERLGIDKHLWVQDVQNRVFSTLGQPNWLAAYLVALSPVAWSFAVLNTSVRRYIWAGIGILFFVVLLFTRSRSGLIGFAVADIVFWAITYWHVKKTHKASSKNASESPKKFQSLALKLGTGIHAVLALVIFVNGSNVAQIDRYASFAGLRDTLIRREQKPTPAPTPTAPLLEVGGTESGTIRKYVWQGAINAWKSTTKTMLIGTGTETFAFAFYQHRPREHNMTSEWDFLYNKAHNEYLNYLATTGILGLTCYMSFLIVFIVWFLRSMNAHTPQHIALFAGWASILITNFFGFSVVIMQLFLFLFPATVFILSPHEGSIIWKRALAFPSWSKTVTLVLGGVVVFRIMSLWYADTLFASGYRLDRSGQFAQAAEKLDQAIAINPTEPLYRDEIATPLISLAVAAIEQQNATAASQFMKRALSESDRAIQISPHNANFWKTRTKVYYSLSGVDPQFNDAAISALVRARDLSPNDPKIYYNLAILTGRTGENEKAIEFLRQAIELKPNYHDAYYGLYIFYTEMKKPNEAKQALVDYLTTVDPNDKNFREILEKGKK